MMTRAIYRASLLVLIAATCAVGQDGRPAVDLPGVGPVQSEAVASHRTVAPGSELIVAVEVTLKEGWHFYSPRPVAGRYEPKAAELTVEVDDGEHPVYDVHVAEVLWPQHQLLEDPLGDSFAYESRFVAYVRLAVPANVTPGAVRTINTPLTGQACSDRGLCRDITISPSTPIVVLIGRAPKPNPDWSDELAEGMAQAVPVDGLVAPEIDDFPQAAAAGGAKGDESVMIKLLLALIAGLILNVMPCVLPVIPLRILAIVDAAKGSRRRFVTLGLAFAAGVMAFFVALAVANVILRVASDQLFNWGEHFGFVWFRVAMALLMVVLAANLFGAFNVIVPKRIAGLDEKVTARKGSHLGAGGMGLMLAILATPCSFALLIGVFAWAQGQSVALGTLAVLLVGVGMAAPHALLAAFPKLVDYLPRPGRWMELLKQGMGFAVLGVAVWLFGTLIPMDGDHYVVWAAGYAVVLAAGLWMWGTWVRYDWSLRRKVVVRGLAALLAVLAGMAMLEPSAQVGDGSPIDFQPFDEAALVAARADGQVVLVKFSATWCISCRWVDLNVYNSHRVPEALVTGDVLSMKADVSNRGTPASDYLYETLGEQGVPLTVIFPPGDAEPIPLRGKITAAEVIEALKQAAGSPAVE